LYGYVFYVLNPKISAGDDDCGHYFMLVTTVEEVTVQKRSGERTTLLPRSIDKDRIARQFALNEWFTGPFRGNLDRVAAIDIDGFTP
jgi:hypothetical protein